MLRYKEFLKESNYNSKLNKITPYKRYIIESEDGEVISSYVSDSLGDIDIIRTKDKTIMVDVDGNLHSEIFNDWTRQEPPFSLLPLGSLINDSEDILLIGLGLGNVYNILSNMGKNVTCIEYDPQTAEIAQNLLNIPNESLYVGCGSKKISELSDNSFDSIVLDAYDSTGIPSVFYTDEFWKEVKRVSKDNVVITVNYCDPYNTLYKEDYLNLHNKIISILCINNVISHYDENYLQNIYHYFTNNADVSNLEKYVVGNYNPVDLDTQRQDIDYMEVS